MIDPQRVTINRLRRAILLSAAAVLVPVAFVACGDDEPGDEATDTPVGQTATTGTTPDAGETPSPDASPTEGGSDNGELPTNAQDYALETFEAWLDGDTAALEELATDEAVSTLEQNPPADPASWSLDVCDGATGHVSCAFVSTDGKSLDMLVNNEMASHGEPQAVVEVRFS